MHVILLGDSTLDNQDYTDGGPDVVTHLNGLLGDHGRATLLAMDGAVIDNVREQMELLLTLHGPEAPSPAEPPTHIVLSVGGNDLLELLPMLREPVGTVAEGLLRVMEDSRVFGEAYRSLLDEVLALGLPTIVCAVYNGAFPDPAEATMLAGALRIFNHEMIEAGLDRGLPVLDLRRVCNEPGDYWDPIEPNEHGGGKIAAAILERLQRS